MQKKLQQPTQFAELGIEPPFLKALAKLGWTQPTDIQQELIPPALADKDILGQARTGTGKTAAFGLPTMQRIEKNKGLQLLVLVPTRELAVQVSAEMQRLAEGSDLRIVPVYGGQRVRAQLHQLGKKPCVVVGTPGRVIDFIQRGALRFEAIRFVVLDEVDRMLDIGFRDDIRNILSRIKQRHQTIFVSATISPEIQRLARTFMHEPITVDVSRDSMVVQEVRQSHITVHRRDKLHVLRMLLEREQPALTIVFCNTKRACGDVAHRLHAADIDALEIHGDLMQRKRDRVMKQFRKHHLRVLVATDLAARGIDVRGITHIVNYDIPDDPEVYVHRIGRTARMGSFGKALTFVTPQEGKQLTSIEMLINLQIPPEQIEGYEPSATEPEQEPPSPAARQASRYHLKPLSTDSSDASSAPASAKPKKLGARFKPRRRRRR
jgi:ATP-dependent RNA helicase DeaD